MWEKEGRHTNFDTVETKKEARKYHLPEPESRSESREEADGSDAQKIDEEDCKQRIDEPQLENRNSKGSDSERRDDHIGS